MFFRFLFFSLISASILFGKVHCTSIDEFYLGGLKARYEKKSSKIWKFGQKKLIVEPHDYFFFSKQDLHRQKTIGEAIDKGILTDILPETLFFLNKNGLPIGYRVPKTLPLYPNFSIEEHLLKATRDEEYTDSKAIQNLIIRLKRVTEKSDFCFVNLTIDKLAIFENRCYIIDLDCLVKISEFREFLHRDQWTYLEELYSYQEIEKIAEGIL